MLIDLNNQTKVAPKKSLKVFKSKTKAFKPDFNSNKQFNKLEKDDFAFKL